MQSTPQDLHDSLISWDVCCGDHAMGGVTDVLDIAKDHLMAAMYELGVGARGVVRPARLGWRSEYVYGDPLVTFFRRGENEMIMGGVDPDGP